MRNSKVVVLILSACVAFAGCVADLASRPTPMMAAPMSRVTIASSVRENDQKSTMPEPGQHESMANYLKRSKGETGQNFFCSTKVLKVSPLLIWSSARDTSGFAMALAKLVQVPFLHQNNWFILGVPEKSPSVTFDQQQQFWATQAKFLEFTTTFSDAQIRQMSDAQGLLPLSQLTPLQQQMFWDLNRQVDLGVDQQNVDPQELRVSLCRTASLRVRAQDETALSWLGIFNYTWQGNQTRINLPQRPQSSQASSPIHQPVRVNNAAPNEGKVVAKGMEQLVTLSENSDLTAESLVEQIRQQAHAQVYIDKRYETIPLFITNNRESAQSWIGLLQAGLQLKERQVGPIILLSPSQLPMAQLKYDEREQLMKEYYPALMKRWEQLDKRERAQITILHYDTENIPFPETSFIAPTFVPFNTLSSIQKNWVHELALTHPSANTDYETVDLSSSTIELRDLLWLSIISGKTHILIQI